ncbi:HAMP domain-containing methyl-accepting chemotaxis protein [Paenibacillus sp. JX-17]|uniref:HAMP domain-containing methyl-accepting chemotaxis protein n=1 Tax=Paenibacillus lacisoli TaxID=3064525 RepID=A0ABT9C7A7_9BACL|nr:HAMP domain-containing methyl-accepting chemotaxis protein [Paenibacillus sp. JX-17]MDO7905149.1 HAMP domain-containing methyl-accepting chemotaxis protein [Paenibacillus sp. JX-17]
MKMTIRKKLFGGFGLILAFLIAVSTVGLLKMEVLGSNTRSINDKWMPSVTLLGSLNGDISDLERLALNIIVETNESTVKQLEGEFAATQKKTADELKQYENMITTDEEKQLYQKFTSNYNLFLAKIPAVITAGKDNDFDGASKLHQESYQMWTNANNTIMELIELDNTLSKEKSAVAVQSYLDGKTLLLILGIAATIIGLVIAYLISQSISKPVIRLSRSASRIADGDLTEEDIMFKNRDEIAQLAQTFNTMKANLRSLIQTVSDTTSEVVASSEELTAGAEQNSAASRQITVVVQEVAEGTSEQARLVNKSSQSMEEMSVGADQIAIRAQNVSASAQEAYSKSAEGNRMIQEAVQQMDSIHRSVVSMEELMNGLGERSGEIGHIIEAITAIATQTNLLALNAAIEAARAAEHGRGFAVVAGEVGKLAEQSSKSAQQITELVTLIQKDTQNALEAVNRNGREIETGLHSVQQAGLSFEDILESVDKVASEIEEVSAGSQQMSASTDEIVANFKEIAAIAEMAADGTENVSAATEEQLASMEEIASSAMGLSRMAEELQQQIGRFKV